MMLTFAAIDGMAWMDRKRNRPRNGEDFRRRAHAFLIGHLKSGIVNSVDLWSARNALLHVQSSYSDLTKSGHAKSFVYIDSKGQMDIPADQDWTIQPVVLNADAIVDRFEVGIGEFRAFIERSDRIDLFLDRFGQWFRLWDWPNGNRVRGALFVFGEFRFRSPQIRC